MTQITNEEYAANIAVQMRKGFLAYCVLKICKKPMYTSDIITRLHRAELVVVEGTIYPLLSRLRKDGLLEHEWRESESGPPRKYYVITHYGIDVLQQVETHISGLTKTIEKL